MNEDLEKAKLILEKRFCFMEWQRNDAEKRAEKVMDVPDIEYLLSLNDCATKCAHYEIGEGTYDREVLLKKIERAKKEKLDGVFLVGATLNAKDGRMVSTAGYFVRIEWIGSTMCDEIYFTEASYIKAEVQAFQHLFGSFASVASLI